jgi:hypothetical protein
MPTDIEITWPAKHSSLHLVLSEMTTQATWDRAQVLFRPHLPAGIRPDQAIQVDKDVRTGSPQ